MKKLFLLSIFVMLFTFAANAQSPKLTFGNTVHDFGSVSEDGGMITTNFEFVNEGDAPLIISSVLTTCGCATPEWTKEPVAVGGKGFIKVSYNPKGRPGIFAKSVTVRNNSSEKSVVLQIKGEVKRKVQ